MSLNREEIAADLVWRYVERLREARAKGPFAPLSRAELEQLVETLELAGDLPHVLTPDAAAEARKAAVRRRLEAAVAEKGVPAPGPSTPAPAAAPRSPWWSAFTGGKPVPAWQFRAALGAAVVLAFGLGLALPVNSGRGSEAQVKRVRVPVQAAEIGIEPVDEKLVHDLLPRMVRNELPPQQERNLMWHMLVCRGCFEEYTELKHHQGETVSRSAMLAAFRR